MSTEQEIKHKHMIAEYINSIQDPEKRRKMHQFQCEINAALDAVPEEERFDTVMQMWREKVQDLFGEFDKLIEEIKA